MQAGLRGEFSACVVIEDGENRGTPDDANRRRRIVFDRDARESHDPFPLAGAARIEKHFMRSYLFDTKGQATRFIVGYDGERAAYGKAIEGFSYFSGALPNREGTQIEARDIH
jgi:hypothetical protein